MKLLVCPGLPRCGTTYLFEQFRKTGQTSFNIPVVKETNHFSRSETINSDFFAMYPNHTMDRYFIDFSPAYLATWRAIPRIAQACKANEVKIILHLRQPVEQAYAHYLHEIKAHIAKLEQGTNLFYPFFCQKSLDRYVRRRAPLIRMLTEAIGRENIFVINFHSDFENINNLQNRLTNFLRVDGFTLQAERVSPGGWLPYYVYGGRLGFDIAIEDEIRTVPAGVLLLVNGSNSKMWNDLTESVAQNLIIGSASWSRELTKSQAAILYDDVFRDDFLETLQILGLDIHDFPARKPLSATVPELPRTFVERLPLREKVRARVLRSVNTSAVPSKTTVEKSTTGGVTPPGPEVKPMHTDPV